MGPVPQRHLPANSSQKNTKGQQLKGKIVSALFHTFRHFSTNFHIFDRFSKFFLQDFILELRGFITVVVQRDEKIIKENKKKKIKSFCTLVVARLSSSKVLRHSFEVVVATYGRWPSACEQLRNHLWSEPRRRWRASLKLFAVLAEKKKKNISRANTKGAVLLKRRVSAFSGPSRKSLLRTPSKNPS